SPKTSSRDDAASALSHRPIHHRLMFHSFSSATQCATLETSGRRPGQTGLRLSADVRNASVRGSIPLGSTNSRRTNVLAFDSRHCRAQRCTGRHGTSAGAHPASRTYHRTVSAYTDRTTAMEPLMRPLEFGWFLPTSGDTTCYGDAAKRVPPSLDMFDRVVAAA